MRSAGLLLAPCQLRFHGLADELGAALLTDQSINARHRLCGQADVRSYVSKSGASHPRRITRYRFLSQRMHYSVPFMLTGSGISRYINGTAYGDKPMTEAAPTAKICIVGYERECECDHCGRALQHGVRTDRFGTIGADCFNRLIAANRKNFSGNGKPGAAWVRTLAKLRERDSDESLRRLGYGPWHFQFELA